MFHRMGKFVFWRFVSMLSIGSLLLTAVTPVQAGLFSGPSVKLPSISDSATEVEQRYHVNTESIQDQGEGMNVMNNKKDSAQVSVFFTPGDPKEGEKISAKAFPIYFSNDTKQMYYTWYLQRKGCTKQSGPLSSTLRDQCDMDKNGKINEEDWKIAAMKIIASNGFDTKFANYSGSDTDNDGYSARFGGDNRVNVPKYCYFHDTESGLNYEIVGDTGEPDFGCTGGKQPVCMESPTTISPGAGGTTQTSLANGLALYYRFDDGTGTTASDSSSNSDDGTLTNGPLWSSAGQIQGTIDFDGSDDFVQAETSSTLNLTNGNFTLAGWFNRDTFTADHTILAKRASTSASDTGYIVYIDDATDRLVFEASDGTDEYELQSSTTFTSTGWHHFTVTWNDSSASDTKIYIDGALDTGSTTGTLSDIDSLSNSSEFRVGAESDGDNPFDGKLDEIRLYSRMLSTDEISDLHNLTQPTEDAFGVGQDDPRVSGFPYCSSSGVTSCINGTPCCVTNPSQASACEQDITGGSCSVETLSSSGPSCKHLFPNAPGETTGDASFGIQEEEFWGTDPHDPDTADNGSKDEANVAGLGIQDFTWNYSKGDKVGVVVEGVSVVTTKHADSSNMIMWAFSKNNCPSNGRTGSYQDTVKGYDINIPSIEINLNDCLEANLLDPLQGGQATKLEVSLMATPDDPVNDSTDRNVGDVVSVISSLNNSAQSSQNTFYQWNVDISPNGTANPTKWSSILPSELMNPSAGGDRHLLSPVRGNGLEKLYLTLNLKPTDQLSGKPFSSYLSSEGVGYFRFRLDVAENFDASGANRRGRSDVIVKFISTQDKIGAFTVTAAGDPTTPATVRLNDQEEICSGTPILTGNETEDQKTEKKALARLDVKLCRVVKNEIIGLKLIGNNLNNFSWSINGSSMTCNSKVSPINCGGSTGDQQQGAVNFFPVIGNIGDVFTVTVTANKVDFGSGPAPASSQKVVTLTRSFKVVEPEVAIVSADKNLVWPKVLGTYADVSGKTYPNYSKNTLQAFSGSQIKLEAAFTPDFLGRNTPPKIERAWVVDGQPVGDGSSNAISFNANKPAGSIYNIGLNAVYRPDALTRKALQDIWQISNLDSIETYFSTESQLEHPEDTTIAQTGVNKYLALLSSYLPAPLFFSIRIFLSVGLILFVTSFLFAFVPDAPTPSRFKRFHH